MVVVAVRLHLAGLARRTGLVDGELRRSAFLQILGDCLNLVGRQACPTALPGSARVSSALQKETSLLERRVRAKFQSMVTSPIMMMICFILRLFMLSPSNGSLGIAVKKDFQKNHSIYGGYHDNSQ